jgi:hypothetical protein
LERLESRDVPAVFHVTTLTDGIGNGSLRDAIVQSNATPGHNDIQIDVLGTHALSAQYGELLITNGDVLIWSPLNGPLPVIDGGTQGFRVFHIRAGGDDVTTTLSGLVIENGQTDGNGGGILVEGDHNNHVNLTLAGTRIFNCSAREGGGFALNGQTSASLDGCTIRNNTAFLLGGGCFATGYTALTIRDCTFDGNNANQGGAVGAFTPLDISGSIFSNNTTRFNGGGIWADGGTYRDCKFVGNRTPGAGGGLLSAYDVTISGCTFSNNSSDNFNSGGADISLATNARIISSTFDHNSAAGSGGGLTCADGAFTSHIDISGCTFSDNTAGMDGGGVAAYGGGETSFFVTLTNCTLAGNRAGYDGGGLFVGGFAGMIVKLDYCTVAANEAGVLRELGHGGGVCVSPSTRSQLSLHASIVANNTATDGTDVFGVVVSQGYNLIGNGDSSTGWIGSDMLGTTGQEIDPGLDPLGNYGGPTQTMRLRADSPAVAAGDANDFPLTDQRGRLRPAASVPCIGAFELYPDDLG